MKPMWPCLRALFVLFLLAAALPARAAEEISRYSVDLAVGRDGSLEVWEAIAVNAEGYQIRRGIYRDIPVRETDGWGLWSDHGIQLLGVTRNGVEEPYHTERQGRFLRIYVGDADVLLDYGRHTYVIHYRMARQLRHFDTYDELYWNVTGNFWDFPILAAEATVRLPDGAVAEKLVAYTGGFGAAGRDYVAMGEGTATPTFRLTKPLQPRQGMTIAVGFTKGAAAIQAESLAAKLVANLGLLLIVLGFAGIPIYYLYAWNRVGRDPEGRPVIPLFHPPLDLEPAALSYVHFNAFRSSGTRDFAFIAALLSLGVKKWVVIEDDDGDVTLTRSTEPMEKRQELGPGEEAFYSRLLGRRESFPFTKANGQSLLAARSALQLAISRDYSGKYYKLNLGWYIPGVVLALILLIGGLILQQPPDEGLAYVIPAAFTAIVGSGLFIAGRLFYNDPLKGFFRRVFGSLLGLVGLAILAVGVMIVVFGDDMPAYRIAAALVFIGILVTVLMAFLIGAPTPEGAHVYNDIEGFKLYLETAETDRLNLRDAPEMSEELFERFLPYAAGLGVEEPWSNAWEAHIARAEPDRERDIQPRWYHGSSWSPGNIGAATAASVAAVSSAMAASMPAPKSSSGSSGGGFSGGGGGGGGGGGW